jgi:hypothetical protein
MRNHKSITVEVLAQKGPSKIALMVASEFYRAASGSDYHADVASCFDRARELMGVLETIPLPSDIASDLRPIYNACRASLLEKVAQQEPGQIREIAEDFAHRFDLFGKRLAMAAAA